MLLFQELQGLVPSSMSDQTASLKSAEFFFFIQTLSLGLPEQLQKLNSTFEPQTLGIYLFISRFFIYKFYSFSEKSNTIALLFKWQPPSKHTACLRPWFSISKEDSHDSCLFDHMQRTGFYRTT